MKITASQVLTFATVAIAGVIVFRTSQAVKNAAGAVGTAVNPTSQENFINRGVNQVGDLIDDAEDNESFSIGSRLFDFVQRVRGIPPFDPNADIALNADNQDSVAL